MVEADERSREVAAVAYGVVAVAAEAATPMAVVDGPCSDSYAVFVSVDLLVVVALVDQEMGRCWPIGNLDRIVLNLATDYREAASGVGAVEAVVETLVLTYRVHGNHRHLVKVESFHCHHLVHHVVVHAANVSLDFDYHCHMSSRSLMKILNTDASASEAEVYQNFPCCYHHLLRHSV